MEIGLNSFGVNGLMVNKNDSKRDDMYEEVVLMDHSQKFYVYDLSIDFD